jgi:hypothetical protein
MRYVGNKKIHQWILIVPQTTTKPCRVVVNVGERDRLKTQNSGFRPPPGLVRVPLPNRKSRICTSREGRASNIGEEELGYIGR